MILRDPIFMGAFLFSLCLHFTFVAGWNNALRSAHAPPAVLTGNTVLIYQLQRALVSAPEDAPSAASPAPSSATSSGSSTGQGAGMGDYLAAIAELPKMKSATKIGASKPGSGSGSGSGIKPVTTVKPKKQWRNASVKISRLPRVKDIDLSDATIFKTVSTYVAVLSSHIQRQAAYPSDVLRDGREGTVYLMFALDRHGRASTLSVSESSGDARLDQAALVFIKKSNPFPPFPGEIKENKMTLYLPVTFQLS